MSNRARCPAPLAKRLESRLSSADIALALQPWRHRFSTADGAAQNSIGIPANERVIVMAAETQGQSHAFQADVARLLHLMVHSVYSDRDIFLRELISNGA
ncbi:MAG: hypothetical protein ABSF34_21985, partial [Verrucomicrobiota bacterium]